VLLYPFLGEPSALVRPCLIFADGYRHTPFLAPNQRITHQSRHRAHHRFDIGFALLQQVEKLLGAGSRVRSHDRVRVIPADSSLDLMASANSIDALASVLVEE
jgi:hypothetical protein